MKTGLRKNYKSVLVILLGLAAAAIPYWMIPYEAVQLTSTPFVLKWAAGALAGGVVATFLLKGEILSSAVSIVLGFILAVVVRIIFDLTLDPTNHNLWPVEVMITVLISFPAAWIGAGIGKLVGDRIRPQKTE